MISKGNYVKFARFVLLIISEEAKTVLTFFFVLKMYNKKIIRFGFCDIQADNPYLDLDYSGYHKNLIQIIVYYYFVFSTS